jgi:hypothetical protein
MSRRSLNMTSDLMEEQRREWRTLYDQIRPLLQQFGEEDDGGEWKDYLLLDENLGLWHHRIETSNLEIVRPAVVKSLQRLLIGYPNWEIVIAVGNPGKKKIWPAMGLVISEDEIVDGLQRQYFPKEFQSIEYEGSRPQGSHFSDILYTDPGPF